MKLARDRPFHGAAVDLARDRTNRVRDGVVVD